MSEWKCLRCGQCCGIVPFQKNEYERVKDTGVQFVENAIFGRVCYIPASALKTGTCPFYDKKKKICTVYDKRPQVCRDFGDGSHPCLVCPHNPRYNAQAVQDTLERVKGGLNGQTKD